MAEYKQVKISVDPQVAAAFKTACAKAGVSMAGELTQFMRGKTGKLETQSKSQKMTTRKTRRKAAQRILSELNMLLGNEETYMDRIPDNLQGGIAYESALQTVDLLGQVIELLEEAF
jgi:hypothetical protein